MSKVTMFFGVIAFVLLLSISVVAQTRCMFVADGDPLTAGDQVVYDKLVERGNSMRRAYAFTVTLNWYLNSMMRINFNYSETRFYDDLFLGTNPRGYSYHEDREQVWVTRFQLEF